MCFIWLECAGSVSLGESDLLQVLQWSDYSDLSCGGDLERFGKEVEKGGQMHREVWMGGERKAIFMHNKIILSSQVTFLLGFLPFVLCL